MEEAASWVERSGNDRARCFLLTINCRSLIDTGQYEAALKIALDSIELAKRIGEGILSIFFFVQAGQAALYGGKTEYAVELLQRGETEGKKLGHPLGLAYIRTSLANALIRSGYVEEAVEPAKASLLFCHALDLGPFYQGALLVNAEIVAHLDPLEWTRIEKLMGNAAALVKRGHSPWEKIRYLMTWARISLKHGRNKNARKYLAEARALYLEMDWKTGPGS